MTLPLAETTTDNDIWQLLYADRGDVHSYCMPDYGWMEQELRTKGVTLLSFWGLTAFSVRNKRSKPMGTHNSASGIWNI